MFLHIQTFVVQTADWREYQISCGPPGASLGPNLGETKVRLPTAFRRSLGAELAVGIMLQQIKAQHIMNTAP